MAKILYIHGFASCGEGNKSLTLQSYFGEEEVITMDLPPSPKDAVEKLDGLICSFKVTLLIGSSLGGFYATYLAEKYQLKAVLINPSTEPWETLSPYVGWQKRFCDEEVFEFKALYLEHLKTLKKIPKRGNYLVLLQSEDEVLDYTKAHSFYKGHKIIVEYGGNHRFENIDDYLSMIVNFR